MARRRTRRRTRSRRRRGGLTPSDLKSEICNPPGGPKLGWVECGKAISKQAAEKAKTVSSKSPMCNYPPYAKENPKKCGATSGGKRRRTKRRRKSRRRHSRSRSRSRRHRHRRKSRRRRRRY